MSYSSSQGGQPDAYATVTTEDNIGQDYDSQQPISKYCECRLYYNCNGRGVRTLYNQYGQPLVGGDEVCGCTCNDDHLKLHRHVQLLTRVAPQPLPKRHPPSEPSMTEEPPRSREPRPETVNEYKYHQQKREEYEEELGGINYKLPAAEAKARTGAKAAVQELRQMQDRRTRLNELIQDAWANERWGRIKANEEAGGGDRGHQIKVGQRRWNNNVGSKSKSKRKYNGGYHE